MSRRSSSDRRTAEFIRLLAQHERRLAGYVLGLMGHVGEADDMLQDVKLRLWEEFDRFKPGTDFGAWACTVAHYLVLAHRKRQSRSKLLLSDQVLNLLACDLIQAGAEADARARALDECMGQIDERQRGLLLQVYGGGRSIRSVAQALGRSVEATYKAIQRTRLMLYDCIKHKTQREGA